jgi:hypothetical protein
MNIPLDLPMAIAVIGCLLAVSAFIDQRRKSAMMEGRHLAEVKALEDRVVAAETSVKSLQACYQTTESDIREIKTDLSWIKQALTELKESLARVGDDGK